MRGNILTADALVRIRRGAVPEITEQGPIAPLRVIEQTGLIPVIEGQHETTAQNTVYSFQPIQGLQVNLSPLPLFKRRAKNIQIFAQGRRRRRAGNFGEAVVLKGDINLL